MTGLAALDWGVLLATIAAIVIYGAWRSRGVRDVDTYVRGAALRWPTIGLSIMATQASAITFLSLPGQAFADGMRFVQFYFGLPLAMIVISAVFVPVYHRLKVRTAYEYPSIASMSGSAARRPADLIAAAWGVDHDLRAVDRPVADPAGRLTRRSGRSASSSSRTPCSAAPRAVASRRSSR